jgi:hypothetical protein
MSPLIYLFLLILMMTSLKFIYSLGQGQEARRLLSLLKTPPKCLYHMHKVKDGEFQLPDKSNKLLPPKDINILNLKSTAKIAIKL